MVKASKIKSRNKAKKPNDHIMEEQDDSEWVKKLKEQAKKTKMDYETLKRIHLIKLAFCEKKNMFTAGKEPDLLKKFVPFDTSDVKAITQSVLDGSYDLEAEESKLQEWIEQLEQKSSTSKLMTKQKSFGLKKNLMVGKRRSKPRLMNELSQSLLS